MIRRRLVPALLASAVLAACAACAGARARGGAPASTTARAFPVPGHGTLTLAVPAGWTAEAAQAEAPLPMAVRLAPGRAGARFVALVTPVWDPDAPDDPARAETAQALAELARRKALEGSVEKEIALEELVGSGVHGYWFTATDRSLLGKEKGPDEWRSLVQGAAVVGELLVMFEVLDDGPGPHRQAMLDVIRTARHAPPAEKAPPPARGGDEEEDEGAFSPDPDVDTVPLSVEYPGQRWSVLVDLPGFAAAAPRRGSDGRSVMVLAENPESGVVASVLLAAAPGAGAAACRERDLARIRAAIPDLRDLRLSEEGGVARAEYLVPTFRGEQVRQWNAHAWRERDGVCVHLHLSRMGHEARDHETLETILRTLRFGETL